MATRIKFYDQGLSIQTAADSIEEWFEQYDIFYELQDPKPTEEATHEVIAVYNTRRRAHFISSIAGDVFKLLKSLSVPGDIKTLDYNVLKDTLIKHISPKPTVLAERYEFNKLCQKGD